MKRHASPISAALLLTVGLLVLSTSTALADAKVYQADALCRGPLVPDLSTGALINISSINAVSVYCGIPGTAPTPSRRPFRSRWSTTARC